MNARWPRWPGCIMVRSITPTEARLLKTNCATTAYSPIALIGQEVVTVFLGNRCDKNTHRMNLTNTQTHKQLPISFPSFFPNSPQLKNFLVFPGTQDSD